MSRPGTRAATPSPAAPDYVLMVHAPDLPSAEAGGKRGFIADPTIRRYDMHLVWTRVAFTTALLLSEPSRVSRRLHCSVAAYRCLPHGDSRVAPQP